LKPLLKFFGFKCITLRNVACLEALLEPSNRWAELPWVNESGVDLFSVSSILGIDWNENKS